MICTYSEEELILMGIQCIITLRLNNSALETENLQKFYARQNVFANLETQPANHH